MRPDSRIDDLLRRIKAEYQEMPGLRLTLEQAGRLWGVDAESCRALLRALVDANFLSRTKDGAFVRSNGEQARRGTGRLRRSVA